MAIVASALLAKASTILQDATGVRWPVNTEMLGWLDSAQRQAVLLKPEVLTTTTAYQLSEGTKQALPSGGVLLIDIIRNMGSGGTTPGAAVTRISRAKLDAILPSWHTFTASATVKHFIYDPKNPKVFWVFPGQPSSSQGYVDLVRSVAPTALASVSTNIALDDVFEDILIDYCLFRAFAKQVENTFSLSKARFYQESFMAGLGLRGQAELGTGLLPDVEEQPQQIIQPAG